MQLNIGFIGFGKSTTRYHLPYVLIRKNYRVSWIFNRRRKEELEASYAGRGIRFTDGLDEMLADPALDLVVINTPPSTHYEYALAALSSGKHVLVEKPFTVTSKEATELFELAEASGKQLMSYQNRRYDSDYLAVEQIIRSGKLGRLVEIASHFDLYRPETDKRTGEKEDGTLYGLGVHTIDQIIALFGEPDTIAYDVRAVRETEIDDTFAIDLYYGKLKASVRTSHVALAPAPRWMIHGTNGTFIKQHIDRQELDLKANYFPGEEGFGADSEDDYGRLIYHDERGHLQEVRIPSPPGDYGRLYDALYDSIVHGMELPVKKEETLLVQRILEAGFTRQTPFIHHLNSK